MRMCLTVSGHLKRASEVHTYRIHTDSPNTIVPCMYVQVSSFRADKSLPVFGIGMDQLCSNKFFNKKDHLLLTNPYD